MGRKILFDENEVIDQITDIFLEKGFKNSSIREIEKVTSVQKASLYRTFGDKNKLFELAIARYFDRTEKSWKKQGSGINFLNNFFDRLFHQAKNGKGSKGCLIMNSTVEFNNENKTNVAFQYFEKVRLKLEKEIYLAIQNENLSQSICPNSFSKYLITQAFVIRELSKINWPIGHCNHL